MKFIHIADVHLGAIPDGSKPWARERSKEIRESFEKIIDVCNRERADLLLIAGDLFCRQPLKREIKELDQLFSKLRNTQVVLIAGEHDYIRPSSYYIDHDWSDSVHMIQNRLPQPLYFPHLDTEVWGLSYTSAKVTDALLDHLRMEPSETYRILLAHGGDDTHLPFQREKLAESGFNYIALGHKHQPKIYSKDKMAYAGSLEPLSETETGEHGYILGEITEEGTSITFVPFAKRSYQTLNLAVSKNSTMNSLKKELLSKIEEQGAEHFYTVTLTGRYSASETMDYSELNETGNLLHVIDKTHPDFDILSLSVEHSGDLIGEYMEALHQMPPSPLTSKALNYGLKALLGE